MKKLAKKRILFLTGTRADYGKLKPLLKEVALATEFDCRIFAIGMHTLERYGFTVEQIYKDGFHDVYMCVNQIIGEPMDIILANTVHGLSRYLHDSPPDLIVVHGDRIEALAGAIVGSLRNIPTAHIEGGEISGTIDETIRHAVSKLSHSHFVANEDAKRRLLQMGERKNSIHIIGSPDIDIMLSDDLPNLSIVKTHYEIEFDDYAISIYHPVNEKKESLNDYADSYFSALIDSGLNYIVIYPNNDEGTESIFNNLKRIKNNNHFRCLPSLRFESFISLLKNASFIVGNSSAAIRESPVFGVPSVNVGSRQHGRHFHASNT